MSTSLGVLLNGVLVIVAFAGAAILSGMFAISEVLPVLVAAVVVLGIALYLVEWYNKKKTEMYRQ